MCLVWNKALNPAHFGGAGIPAPLLSGLAWGEPGRLTGVITPFLWLCFGVRLSLPGFFLWEGQWVVVKDREACSELPEELSL